MIMNPETRAKASMILVRYSSRCAALSLEEMSKKAWSKSKGKKKK
jgi:hypothetical protein